MTTHPPPEPLTESERRNWRERFLLHRAQLQQQLDTVSRIITELERLCAHDMVPRGRTGPYEHQVCARCGAEEFIS